MKFRKGLRSVQFRNFEVFSSYLPNSSADQKSQKVSNRFRLTKSKGTDCAVGIQLSNFRFSDLYRMNSLVGHKRRTFLKQSFVCTSPRLKNGPLRELKTLQRDIWFAQVQATVWIAQCPT